MTTSITHLVMLAVFSGMAMNLILQFGIGLKGIAFDEPVGKEKLPAGCGLHFITLMLLWLLFSFIRSVFFLGLMEYIVLFPLSVLVFSCLEYLCKRFILKKEKWPSEYENSLAGGSFTGGILSGAGLFIMLNIAGGLLEALILALGFTCSTALVFVIAAEIRRRSKMEAVPHWLRGGPLALVALGLLSLIFSSGAMMLFNILGAD